MPIDESLFVTFDIWERFKWAGLEDWRIRCTLTHEITFLDKLWSLLRWDVSNIEQNKYAGASRGGSLQTLTELKTPLLLSYSTSLSSLSSTTTNSAPWSPDRPEASTHSTSAHPARRIGKAFNKTLISSNSYVSGGDLLLLPLLLRGASPPPRRTWRPAWASTLSGAMQTFSGAVLTF